MPRSTTIVCPLAGPPAGRSVHPATAARFTVVKRDTVGFSITHRVRDGCARFRPVAMGRTSRGERIRQTIADGLERR
jgi:hypothetical protein